MPGIFEIINGLWTSDPEIVSWYVSQGRVLLDYLHLIFDSMFYFFLYMAIVFTSIYLVLSIFTVFFKHDKKERKFDASKAPFVTIQIPTRNELVALRCAKRCVDFDYPKDKYEVLIGDDSDDKSISNKLKAFAEKNKIVRVIKRAKNIGFKPGNLNKMLEHSKGEILVIFDSDFTPEKDFLKRIINPFIYDKDVAAVQARWKFSNFSQNMVTMLASTIVYIFHHIVLIFLSYFGTGSLCGSAEAIRKKDLIRLGRWKSGSLTEDIEYSLRMHKNNKKILYLPKLECYNEAPHIATDLYKQQMRWAYGVITSYKSNIKGILFDSVIPAKRKILSLFAGFGYVMPVLIIFMFATGTLSFLTHSPGPIDIPRFFSELGINVVLTSGILIASLVALYREKKIRYVFKTLLASFSVGIVTTYYVNKGIFRSMMKKPMQWYMLNKDSSDVE
ncbi:glycosyltransferase [Candidatus Woesearchaeota archaeon]|nr:glycosyltransferase [Candidatus Woesearchaeota archaeon]